MNSVKNLWDFNHPICCQLQVWVHYRLALPVPSQLCNKNFPPWRKWCNTLLNLRQHLCLHNHHPNGCIPHNNTCHTLKCSVSKSLSQKDNRPWRNRKSFIIVGLMAPAFILVIAAETGTWSPRICHFSNRMDSSTKNIKVPAQVQNQATASWHVGTADKLNNHLSTKHIDSLLSTVVPPFHPHTTTVITKADSGASRHYFCSCDQHVIKGHIPIPRLGLQATEAHIFDKLQSSSLISLGQLCDDDCTVLLNKRYLLAFKNLHHNLYGTRNKTDGLWDIHIPVQNTLRRQ